MEAEEFQSDPILSKVLSHMQAVRGKVSTEDLAFVMGQLSEKQAELNALEAEVTKANKVIMRMKSILTSVMKDLGWDEFKSPHGSVKITPQLQVKMPQSPEAKAELWAWMREKGIYDRYATVHAVSLKALFKAEMEVAKAEQGEDFDPIGFHLPGMDPATYFEDLKFTPPKNK